MKRIEVAVGLILERRGKVLVGQRTVKDRYFGKWEFPGGKLEIGETAEQALARELREEIGIEVEQLEELMTLEHDYPDRKVRLYVLRVGKFHGDVEPREGQALVWLKPSELEELDLLEGNQPIVKLLAS